MTRTQRNTALLLGGALLLTAAQGCGGKDDGGGKPSSTLPPGCSASEVECDGACYAPDALPAGCRACEPACSASERCVDGQCVEIGKPPPAPPVVLASCSESFVEEASCAAPAASRTFYVSSSLGADANDGQSEAAPVKSLRKAGALAARPGDRVLFKCGDVWRGEHLELKHSGAACAHIVYGSYPATCADQPRFTGSRPISGWTRENGSVWVADLGAGENAGQFPKGINQLFRGERRLPLGRWPNPGQNGTDITEGYSHIDRAEGSWLEDDQLPAGDWGGAVMRYQPIRWQLPNRRVTGASGKRLTLNAALGCWGGGCGKPGGAASYGWGYVLTSHRATLDVEDEWYFDAEAGRVYLLSAAEPSEIEGSVIDADVDDVGDSVRGLVVLGPNLEAPIHHVVVENLRLENGFRHGVTTPVNHVGDDASNLILRCSTIRNVDAVGINLATWVFDASNGRDGWRGGRDVVVQDNVVDGANHFGVKSYARQVIFAGNSIRNVGLAENLNESGLGCSFEEDGCTENGDGLHFPRGGENPQDASFSVVVRENHIERTGYCGMDVFGEGFTIERNVIREACSTKGDCGGIRTFGGDSYESTFVKDIVIEGNLIVDIVGVTHAANSDFAEHFGFGLYIDHHSVGVTSAGNVVSGVSATGILYQDSRGVIRDNLVYGTETRTLLTVSGEGARVEPFTGNVLVATSERGGTASFARDSLGGADGNTYFNPYAARDLSYDDKEYDLAGFRQATGGDASSTAAWYEQPAGQAPRTELFLNDQPTSVSVPLTGSYQGLDQAGVSGSLELAPVSGRVLVKQ